MSVISNEGGKIKEQTMRIKNTLEKSTRFTEIKILNFLKQYIGCFHHSFKVIIKKPET